MSGANINVGSLSLCFLLHQSQAAASRRTAAMPQIVPATITPTSFPLFPSSTVEEETGEVPVRVGA